MTSAELNLFENNRGRMVCERRNSHSRLIHWFVVVKTKNKTNSREYMDLVNIICEYAVGVLGKIMMLELGNKTGFQLIHLL